MTHCLEFTRTNMNADTLTEAILVAIQPAIEQAINERINALVKKLKLDEKKVWAALCEGTPAEAKTKGSKTPKTTARLVDGKPPLTAPVTGNVQKLVLVNPYSEKSFAITSVIPDDTKNIKDHLKAMDLKYNNKAKVGTAIWVGQLSKLDATETKLKELGLKYRKMSLSAYEKEVKEVTASKNSPTDETENAEDFEEPEIEAPVEEVEVENVSDEEVAQAKPVAKAKSTPKSAVTSKGKAAASKALPLQVKKNKWGNSAHEGYVFEKLPLGSNGAKIDAVIGVQDIKAPATKKEYASILPLSEKDLVTCAANGWRTIDDESLVIIKKKDAKKYEVLAKILKGKSGGASVPVKGKTVKAKVKTSPKAKAVSEEEEVEPAEEEVTDE